MRYTVYKPNTKVTGALATFSIGETKNKKEEWEKTLFIEFIPQKSWNAEKHSGSFDYEKKKFVAINLAEAGEFIHSIRSGFPYTNFHKSAKGTSVVKIASYNQERKVGQEGQKGFWKGEVRNVAVGVSFNGVNINVPLSPGEQEVVVALLDSYIKQSIAQEASNEKKRRKNRENASPKKDEKESSGEIFDEAPNMDDLDDVPF